MCTIILWRFSLAVLIGSPTAASFNMNDLLEGFLQIGLTAKISYSSDHIGNNKIFLFVSQLAPDRRDFHVVILQRSLRQIFSWGKEQNKLHEKTKDHFLPNWTKTKSYLRQSIFLTLYSLCLARIQHKHFSPPKLFLLNFCPNCFPRIANLCNFVIVRRNFLSSKLWYARMNVISDMRYATNFTFPITYRNNINILFESNGHNIWKYNLCHRPIYICKSLYTSARIKLSF